MIPVDSLHSSKVIPCYSPDTSSKANPAISNGRSIKVQSSVGSLIQLPIAERFLERSTSSDLASEMSFASDISDDFKIAQGTNRESVLVSDTQEVLKNVAIYRSSQQTEEDKQKLFDSLSKLADIRSLRDHVPLLMSELMKMPDYKSLLKTFLRFSAQKTDKVTPFRNECAGIVLFVFILVSEFSECFGRSAFAKLAVKILSATPRAINDPGLSDSDLEKLSSMYVTQLRKLFLDKRKKLSERLGSLCQQFIDESREAKLQVCSGAKLLQSVIFLRCICPQIMKFSRVLNQHEKQSNRNLAVSLKKLAKHLLELSNGVLDQNGYLRKFSSSAQTLEDFCFNTQNITMSLLAVEKGEKTGLAGKLKAFHIFRKDS